VADIQIRRKGTCWECVRLFHMTRSRPGAGFCEHGNDTWVN